MRSPSKPLRTAHEAIVAHELRKSRNKERFGTPVFTLPDGTGGNIEALEELLAVDTVHEWEQARQAIGYGVTVAHSREGTYYRSVSEKVAHHRARSQLVGGDAEFTERDWRDLKAAFSGCCAYCLQHRGALHMEHVVPVSAGGSTTLWNIVPACRKCNQEKGPHEPSAWLPSERLAQFIERCLLATEKLAKKNPAD